MPLRPGRHAGRISSGRGFTLLELLIVITLIAIASAVASLALRDPDATRLEREATRLAALFEAARAQSRALGVPVQWRLGPSVGADGRLNGDFQFQGLPPDQREIPTRWLDRGGAAPIQVELPPAQAIVLGPEPVIGAQRLLLRSGTQALALVTDGLGPFTVSPVAAETP